WLREAAVVARADGPGAAGAEKRLVAYAVPKDGADVEVADLRRHLAEKLPEYMLPSAFVLLDAMPVTANGKLDRKALPAPGSLRPALKSDFAAPRNATEALLAELWSQLLGVEQVGIHDNFFELGGDSIVSIQVIARAAQSGLRLTARQMFQLQTIAELAAVA